MKVLNESLLGDELFDMVADYLPELFAAEEHAVAGDRESGSRRARCPTIPSLKSGVRRR
jgi:hypothetical protein